MSIIDYRIVRSEKQPRAIFPDFNTVSKLCGLWSLRTRQCSIQGLHCETMYVQENPCRRCDSRGSSFTDVIVLLFPSQSMIDLMKNFLMILASRTKGMRYARCVPRGLRRSDRIAVNEAPRSHRSSQLAHHACDQYVSHSANISPRRKDPFGSHYRGSALVEAR